MDFELMQRRRWGKIIHKKKPLSYEIKRGIYFLLFGLLFIIVILSIVFLLNTSQSSQKGYILQQDELKKEELTLENHALKTKITDAQTSRKIEDDPIVKAMQKPVNLQYVQSAPS